MEILRRTVCCWSVVVLLVGCGSLRAQEKSPDEMQKSCRSFVQDFYNWHLRNLESGGDYGKALKYKRNAFSPELLRLLKQAEDHLTKTGDAILDFDPIIGGQDWPKHIVVGKARIQGDRCWVDKAELVFKDGRWVFVNFHYGKDPKYPMNENLLSILKYLLRPQPKKAK